MADRATLTNDDLEQISQASEQVLKKVKEKQEKLLAKGKVVSIDEFRDRGQTTKGNVVSLSDYKKKKESWIDSEIGDYCRVKTEEFDGDSGFEDALRSKVKEMIISDELKTDKDQIKEVAAVLAEKSPDISGTATEVEAKKIVLEANKLQETHIDEVREIRKENFTRDFVEEVKRMNPEITDDQLDLVRQEADLINQVYDGGIEKWKNEALETNPNIPIGKMVNSWNDVQGIIGLFKKTPEDFKKIQTSYEQIREGLGGLNLPFEKLPKLGSFERIMNSLYNTKMGEVFQLVQGGGWMQKVDRLTGGWLNKTIIETSGKFISKIGNQAAREFIQNSVGILAKEGFNNGLRTILSGVLKGGVKAAGQAAASGAAASGAAAASASVPVVGWVVAGAFFAFEYLLKPLFNKLKGLFKSLGLELGIKKFFQDTFGKILGGLLNFVFKTMAVLVGIPLLLVGGSATTILAPVIIGVFVFLFGYQMMQNNLVSTIVPPVEKPLTSEETGNESITGASCAGGVLNLSNMYEPIDMSKVKTRLYKSEYSFQNNGNINFSCINGLLPEKLTHKRSDIMKAAYALLGVPYWMGGGHGTIASGVSSDWGKKVSAPGSGWNTGRRYHGLDCSGFVRWVYMYVTGTNVGGLSADIYGKSQKISKSELKPGDIGFLYGNASNHIGMFFGKGTNGKYYFIHDAGRSSGVGPQGLGGVYISAANFTHFGRIKVNLID
ncbi:MAG: NlpC/P60 family protein [Candidatus Shapirobacteria bacterium]|nr:NlpC/P60 family protein [Candidatus Shapirobacteria bacterium]